MAKMLKLNQLLPTRATMEETRNGKLSMLIKLKRLKLRESMKNSASISIDHSTSDQECQWRELSLCTAITGSTWEDGLQVTRPIHNGDSMREPRPSSTSTGRTTSWKSTETEDIHTSDQQLQSTQDGGNCSELRELTLEPLRRMWTSTSTFKVLLILKEDTSNAMKPRTEESINNGISSTLINGRVNQLRDNSTKSTDFTSKDHSMLSQP